MPEKLVVPFNAIRGFYDPSVNFELEFDVPLGDEEELPEAEKEYDPVKLPIFGIKRPQANREKQDRGNVGGIEVPVQNKVVP